MVIWWSSRQRIEYLINVNSEVDHLRARHAKQKKGQLSIDFIDFTEEYKYFGSIIHYSLTLGRRRRKAYQVSHGSLRGHEKCTHQQRRWRLLPKGLGVCSTSA